MGSINLLASQKATAYTPGDHNIVMPRGLILLPSLLQCQNVGGRGAGVGAAPQGPATLTRGWNHPKLMKV